MTNKGISWAVVGLIASAASGWASAYIYLRVEVANIIGDLKVYDNRIDNISDDVIDIKDNQRETSKKIDALLINNRIDPRRIDEITNEF